MNKLMCKVHDLYLAWFGLHVQYKCRNCNYMETYSHTTGARLD